LLISEFYAQVSAHCDKGTNVQVETEIPLATARAVGFIEANYNLRYMRKVTRYALASRTLVLPIWTKKVEYARRADLGQDGSERYDPIPQATTPRVLSIELDSDPSGFVLQGERTMIFDAFRVTAPVTTVDVFAVEKTNWSVLPVGTEPWLLSQAQGAVLGRTMVEMAPFCREPDWVSTYGIMYESHLKVLTLEQDDFDASGGPEEWTMRPSS
jgi:hypothetical protein